MQPINEMKLEFPSKSCNESFARIAAAAFISQLDPTVEELADVKTAVSEAVTNAIIHGYCKKPGLVVLHCRLFPDSAEVVVQDAGEGIENLQLARQPLYTSRPELERSGMGFTVMESFMDRVDVESIPGKGTTVTLFKRFGSLK